MAIRRELHELLTAAIGGMPCQLRSTETVVGNAPSPPSAGG
jgi:hypothetical protein